MSQSVKTYRAIWKACSRFCIYVDPNNNGRQYGFSQGCEGGACCVIETLVCWDPVQNKTITLGSTGNWQGPGIITCGNPTDDCPSTKYVRDYSYWIPDPLSGNYPNWEDLPMITLSFYSASQTCEKPKDCEVP